MAARHRFTGRGRGNRRETDWSQFFEETFTLGTTAVQLGAVGFTTSSGTSTLARVHGILSVYVHTVTAIDDGFRGAIGIGKVSNEAFSTGVAAVPDPVTEVAWDGWLYHQWFDVRGASATEGELISSPISTFRSVIDVKAMRKIDSDENFVVVINAIETGTAQGLLRIQTRSLELLP